MCVTKESAQKFKEEFTKALIEQIQEPIRIQLHQPMLARDSHNKLKETKKLLAKTREEAARQQLIVQDLQQENGQMRHQLHDVIQRAEKAEARVQDVDQGAVMRMLGYKAVPGQQRGVTDFIKTDKNQLISVFPGAVYDGQGQMVARTSVALIQEVMRREGHQISRADAVGWLADHCGDERAKAASLVEREQATEDFLHERRKERERTNLTPARDETLSRPEFERILDRVADRDGRDHDFGLTR